MGLAPFDGVAEQAGQACPRHPLVLMHGMGLLPHMLVPGAIFDRIARHLRACGVAAHAPRVQPYSPLHVRAATWHQHCQALLAETGAERLNLVGFSSGGLDARYLVRDLGGARYVASITTVATPHRGSALAALPFMWPRRARQAAFAAVGALAHHVYPQVVPDVEATLRELMPGHGVLDPAAPAPRDVAVYSVAACAGRGAHRSVSFFLRPLQAYVYAREGANDGFVSVGSATWHGFLGCAEADHADLAGLSAPWRSFDAPAWYRTLAAFLATQGV